ncbi:multicopper oxidase domain-containing protein, partial [Sphingobacterium multivorum]
MYKKSNILTVVLLLMTQLTVLAQKVVRHDLYVRDTIVNYAGKSKRAIAVNGQIPMPTLTFTEGDTAEIVVHNELKESTSLHWHGIFLPNKEDGVPHLTQEPIKPNSTYTYRFPIIQHGTHWYHSHSGLQEQIGMYGSLILNKRADDKTFRKGIDDLPTIPVILSEWTNYNPDNIQRMLHTANDWAAIKKGSTQSYVEAIKEGKFKTKVTNEWKRQLAMDVSDVYYDKVLMNGAHSTDLKSVNGKALKAGDKVRLRISNGGASSYFWLRYAGGKITVVANDGNDVVPVEVDRLMIAVSETYDVVVTIPNEGTAYEFMATTEDRTQSASYFVGNGIKQLISPLPRLKYFEGMKMMNDMMKMNGDLNDMGMKMSLNQMDMNVVMYPEITGDGKKKEDHSKHSGMNHGQMNMDEDPNRYNANALGDIVTLN